MPEDYGVYQLRKKDWILYGTAGIFLAGAIAFIFYQSITAFLLLAPLLLIGLPFWQRDALQRKREQRLNLEFKEAAVLISSFLRAGYSPENAIIAAKSEMEHSFGKDAMMTRELSHMTAGIELNKSAESLLLEFADRSASEDIQSFAEVFCIARRSGGDLCAVADHTIDILRDKMAVMEELYTITASRRYEQKIMAVLPAGIILYMNLTSPAFLQDLYHGFLGRAVMSSCLLIFAAAQWLAGRILDIKV